MDFIYGRIAVHDPATQITHIYERCVRLAIVEKIRGEYENDDKTSRTGTTAAGPAGGQRPTKGLFPEPPAQSPRGSPARILP